MVLLKFSDGSKHNIPLEELEIIPYFKTLPTLKDDSQELDLSFNGIFTYGNIIRCISLSEPLNDSCEELMDYFCIDSNFYDKNYVNKMLKLDLNNKEEYNTVILRCKLEPKYLPINCDIIFKYPIEVVKKCITRDNININNCHGNTILIEASKNNEYTEIVKYIIENGANVNLINNYNNTALIYASEKNNIEIVKLLIKAGADIDHQGTNTFTALYRAIEKNNIEIVDLLIKAGADVNYRIQGGLTTLYYARNNLNIVKLLINGGADINLTDFKGNTPLMYASENGNEDIVEFLIESGADINHQEQNNHTALIKAIFGRNRYIIELLIKAGADVNAITVSNDTPLIIATDYGMRYIVELLIKAGANLNAEVNGITALELALRTNKTEIAKILKDAGAQ